jgi:hypothetical protein
MEPLEALDMLAHARFHGRGRLQVTECDLQWRLHDPASRLRSLL